MYGSDLNGVLPVDKPVGPTSHDIVAAARRALGIRRIGHAGTLDPFASGLLLLCIGSATRLAEYLTPLPKSYLATLRLGEATNTDDPEGDVVFRSEGWHGLDEGAVRSALEEQVGSRQQLPPLFSAKKVGGERMHAIARRGGEVERRPATVTIYRLEVVEIRLPEVEFRVECSAGTYIRAIARDAGERLGVGAHLRTLRRTRSGRFVADAAVPAAALHDRDRVLAALASPSVAVGHLPRVVVADADVATVTHGRALATSDDVGTGGPVALVSQSGELLAVAERVGRSVQPRKVFT